jgi:hypothetical protein
VRADDIRPYCRDVVVAVRGGLGLCLNRQGAGRRGRRPLRLHPRTPMSSWRSEGSHHAAAYGRAGRVRADDIRPYMPRRGSCSSRWPWLTPKSSRCGASGTPPPAAAPTHIRVILSGAKDLIMQPHMDAPDACGRIISAPTCRDVVVAVRGGLGLHLNRQGAGHRGRRPLRLHSHTPVSS